MNHRAIVLRQLNDELEALKARQAVIESGISALGGTLGGLPARKRRVRGPNKEKRVAGPERVPEAPQAKVPFQTFQTGIPNAFKGEPVDPASVTGRNEMVAPAAKPNGHGKGGDAPTLIRALKAIQARTDLSAIEKSRESMRARSAFKNKESYIPPPVRKREGAVLGEAGD